MIRSGSTTGLVFAIFLTVCAGCDEIQHRHYETLAAAQSEHMVEKGWIPTFVSADAKDIGFDGDLDSSTVFGSYTSGDTISLRKHCSTADDALRIPVDGPKWFSGDVKEAKTAGKLSAKGYEVFRCDEGNFAVVVLSSRQYVYYWTVRRSN